MEVLQDNEQLDAHLKKITEGPGQVSDLQLKRTILLSLNRPCGWNNT